MTQVPALRIFYQYSSVSFFFSSFLFSVGEGPTDRPNFTRERAVGNETFHGDGVTIIKLCWEGVSSLRRPYG